MASILAAKRPPEAVLSRGKSQKTGGTVFKLLYFMNRSLARTESIFGLRGLWHPSKDDRAVRVFPHKLYPATSFRPISPVLVLARVSALTSGALAPLEKKQVLTGRPFVLLNRKHDFRHRPTRGPDSPCPIRPIFRVYGEGIPYPSTERNISRNGNFPGLQLGKRVGAVRFRSV